MNNFEISYSFDHHQHRAEVTVIKGADHIQYTVSPKDQHLFRKYGTQVFHAFPEKQLQAAFPGSTEAKQEYTEAVAKGLAHFLEKE